MLVRATIILFTVCATVAGVGAALMHLIKLCVGIDSLEELRAAAARRSEPGGVGGATFIHRTRQMPRQAQALVNGGSLYWVIRGLIQARQKLVDIRLEKDADGRDLCALVLDATIVPVSPRPRRPFQGWRYLPDEAAPDDLGANDDANAMPAEMRAHLAELALL